MADWLDVRSPLVKLKLQFCKTASLALSMLETTACKYRWEQMQQLGFSNGESAKYAREPWRVQITLSTGEFTLVSKLCKQPKWLCWIEQLQIIVVGYFEASWYLSVLYDKQNPFWASPRGFGEQGKNCRKEYGDMKVFQGTSEQLNVYIDDGGRW